jgi:hypothetical protein
MSKIEGSDGWDARIMQITPQVAKDWIAKSPLIRRLNMNRVKLHAHAIKAGQWIVGPALYRDQDKKLLDGMTRCKAVEMAGMPIMALVITGLDRLATIGVFDATNERKLKDWLDAQKEPYATELATLIRMAARDEAGHKPTATGGSFYLTCIDGIDFLEEHPELRECIANGPGIVNPLVARSMLAFFWWKARGLDETAARDFLIDLHGTDPDDKDPVYVLREKLRAMHANRRKVPLYRDEQLALIIMAWNAMRRHDKVIKLKWRRPTMDDKGDKWPKFI